MRRARHAAVLAAILFWLCIASIFALAAVFFGALMCARAVQFLLRDEPHEARRRLFWANVLLGLLFVQQVGFFVRGEALVALGGCILTAAALTVSWRSATAALHG